MNARPVQCTCGKELLSPPPLHPAVPGSPAAFALALLAVRGEAAAAVEAYVGGGVGTEEKEKGDVAAAAEAGPLKPS